MQTPPRLELSAEPREPTTTRQAGCPDCGATLARQSGCVVCLSCGWARCG